MTRALLLVGLLAAARSLPAQNADSLSIYSAIIQREPSNSRAVYRMASLERRGSPESIALFERYTVLEPQDAWGYLALAEAQAAAHRFDDAERNLARAETLAPGEADVAQIRTRLLRARREAAPALQPRASFTRDSDGNQLRQLQLVADLSAGAGSRLGLAVTRSTIENDFESTTADEARLTYRVRSAGTRVELAGGAARLQTPAAYTTAVGRARLRWNATPWSAAIDIRATRAPLLVSPLLVANQVVLSEMRATIELPMSRSFRIRGIGQAGDLASNADAAATTSHNTRIGYGGALVIRPSQLAELSATYYQLSYDAPAQVGYFAPRRVQVLELGTYAEVYRLDPLTIAIDAGAGVQRVAEHGGEGGDWRPAAHGWGQLTLPLSRAVELNFEAEAYHSQLNLTATSASWSSLNGALSLRWRKS